MKEKNKKRIKLALTISKFMILVFILVGIPLMIWLLFPQVIEHFNSVDKINTLLTENRLASAFIYVGLQIIQVVICFLPGQVVQMAGGYAFPFLLAVALTLIGIGLGTVFTFLLSRLFGRDMVLVAFGEKRSAKFMNLMNSKKAFIIIFLLYLFPGIPKDIFGYIAGVSKLRLIPFTLLSLAARTPALIASLIFGDMLQKGNYTGMIIIAAIVIVIAVICLIFRKRFTAFIDRVYQRTL